MQAFQVVHKLHSQNVGFCGGGLETPDGNTPYCKSPLTVEAERPGKK
jgi:hypothetical protein